VVRFPRCRSAVVARGAARAAQHPLELAAMQRELLAWQRIWPVETVRSLLALHARNQSDRILQIAGFYDLGD